MRRRDSRDQLRLRRAAVVLVAVVEDALDGGAHLRDAVLGDVHLAEQPLELVHKRAELRAPRRRARIALEQLFLAQPPRRLALVEPRVVGVAAEAAEV